VTPSPRGHVVGDEVTGEETALLLVAEELLDAIEAVDEFPVRGGDLDTALVRDPHHVLAAAPEGGRRTLERVTAVEQQRAPAPLLPNPGDERRQGGVAAHAPVAGGQRREVEVGARVGRGGAVWCCSAARGPEGPGGGRAPPPHAAPARPPPRRPGA